MAVLVPDEKSLVLLVKIFFLLVQYATGYHPWPVAPPTADGASFTLAWRQSIKLRIVAEKGIKVQKEYIYQEVDNCLNLVE